MTDGQEQPRIPIFETALIGQRPSANEHNKQSEAIRRALTMLHKTDRHIGVEMYRIVDFPVGTDQDDKLKFRRRRGWVQKDVGDADAEGNDLSLTETDTVDKIKTIRSSSRTIYDVGERPPGFFHRQSGMVELLNPRFTRNAITVKDASGEYPRCGSNKFPIKFVRREYCKTAGQETARIIYLDSQGETPASETPDAWVFVQADSDGISDFIPEGNVIEAFDNIGYNGKPQWHSNTVYGGTTIIKIPSGGIPAGTVEAPGSARCAVYRLIGEDGSKRYERVYAPVRCLGPESASSASSAAAQEAEPYGSAASGDGLFVWVNNISFVTISGYWGKPTRDRCGDWLIDCPCSPVSSSSVSSSDSSLSESSSPESSESSETSSPESSPLSSELSSELSSPESSEPSSEQPSSDESPSESGSDDGSPVSASEPSRGSDKATAIVPSSWNESGYAALFVIEGPDVRFKDVVRADVTSQFSDIEIDPRFVEVCESGSLEVCGCVAGAPVGIKSAYVVDIDGKKKIHVDLGEAINGPVRVVALLTGIRKGFPHDRFPDRTATQFDQNEAFINSAYERIEGQDESQLVGVDE